MKKTILFLALFFCSVIGNAQTINTVAGNGTSGFSGDGGAATSAQLHSPTGIAFDATGNMYIADAFNHRIRKVNSSGIITTIAGTGVAGFSGNGGPATSAKLNGPTALAFDASGNLYIVDDGNECIRMVNSSGTISTFAGIGTVPGYSGDGGAATSATLWAPKSIAIDVNNNVYIADNANDRIRKVNTSGIISTVAGNGTNGFGGDGGLATSANLNAPHGICVDALGNIYIFDSGNNRIRKVNSSGIISTFAGNGVAGYSGDGGLATSAQLNSGYIPSLLASNLSMDLSGNLYIPDIVNYRIRVVNTSGIISTIAGTGTTGYSGDGGPATSAKITNAEGVAVDGCGNLYIADYSNCRIRKVDMPCPVNAGPNTNDYNSSGNFLICMGTQIGTTPIMGGLTYSWTPNTALSCTNCAQPVATNTATQVYTLTVNGTCCTATTSTVQVTTLTATPLTASITAVNTVPGADITAVGTYTANTTPTNYYWSLQECDAAGNNISGGYSYNSGTIYGIPSGTYTFTGTNSWPCDRYYWLSFYPQNNCVGQLVSTMIHVQLVANAGPNKTNQQDFCGNWTPGVTLGTTGISGASYTWNTGTNLSPTNQYSTTCTYSTPSASATIVYTLTVSKSGCTSKTSTVSVTAVKNTCSGCCRIRNNESINETHTLGEININEMQYDFSIFPNPSNKNIIITIPEFVNYLQITDMYGRILFETKDILDNELSIDISKYGRGFYFVISKMNEHIEKRKLLVTD